MIYEDAVLARELAPHLKRVLVLDASRAGARVLIDQLREFGAEQVEAHASSAEAAAMLARFDPQVVIAEAAGAGLDGFAFVRALRRGDLACRQAAVIMTGSEASAAALLDSRHAGAHEFLRRRHTSRDLLRRLDAAILRQRDWIEAVSYVGPDRRLFNSGDYVGPRKRSSGPAPKSDQERTTQALKILRAAIPAIEDEPVQALRSMRTQADELQRIGSAASDVRLMTAASSLQRCLASAAVSKRLWRPDVEASAAKLWVYLPTDAESKPALAV